MIEIDQTRLAEPETFDKKCRQAGVSWLGAHPKAGRKKNKRPKDFWTPFKPQLAEAFCDLCAYSAMYEPIGTVDHFLPVDADETLAYEWRNFRFAAGWINSSKSKATDILDPLAVQAGWFEVLLPSLQLVVTEHVPDEFRAQAQHTLFRLHLRDDERVIRQRRRWYQMYQEGKLSLEGLRANAPLIAAAIEKQMATAQD